MVLEADFQEMAAAAALPINEAIQRVQSKIIGNQGVIRKLFLALLSDGHVLVEGVPGIAKTKIVVELAAALGLMMKRVSCTPDLLPSDITGTTIFRPDNGTFELHRGPIFTHVLIADEINRTPAKVQSALLEAMAERQVTIFGNTEKLSKPFFVMATQNPIEQEGTYPLPEAQLDRFMFKLMMTTLSIDEEVQIIQHGLGADAGSSAERPSSQEAALLKAMQLTRAVFADPSVIDYIARIVVATRDPSLQAKYHIDPSIQLGASPRASIAFVRGAQASAFLEGRSFITPYDVKCLAHDILRHRIVLHFEAEAHGVGVESVIDDIIEKIPIP